MTLFGEIAWRIDYNTYKANKKELFEITEMLLDDYIKRQPNFIEQRYQEYIKDFVNIKDLVLDKKYI